MITFKNKNNKYTKVPRLESFWFKVHFFLYCCTYILHICIDNIHFPYKKGGKIYLDQNRVLVLPSNSWCLVVGLAEEVLVRGHARRVPQAQPQVVTNLSTLIIYTIHWLLFLLKETMTYIATPEPCQNINIIVLACVFFFKN